MFWFVMLVNEYKPDFYVRKVRKMRNFVDFISGSPLLKSGNIFCNPLYISKTLDNPCFFYSILIENIPHEVI